MTQREFTVLAHLDSCPKYTSTSCGAWLEFVLSTGSCFSVGRHDKVSVLSGYLDTWVTTLEQLSLLFGVGGGGGGFQTRVRGF